MFIEGYGYASQFELMQPAAKVALMNRHLKKVESLQRSMLALANHSAGYMGDHTPTPEKEHGIGWDDTLHKMHQKLGVLTSQLKSNIAHTEARALALVVE